MTRASGITARAGSKRATKKARAPKPRETEADVERRLQRMWDAEDQRDRERLDRSIRAGQAWPFQYL